MAAGATYTQIATTTLGSATNTVTFSSISGSYTDLVLVMNCKGSVASYPYLRFNSDSGANYSDTELRGNGTSATSGRNQNVTVGYFTANAAWTNSDFSFNSILNIPNYANTTTYKSWLSRANNANNGVDAVVGLWRSTAAITTVAIFAASGNFAVDSTFSLYGITAA